MQLAVGQTILDLVYARLSNAANGFNATFATTAASSAYQLTPFTINFQLTNSENFFYGQFDPDLLEVTGIFSYPFMTMYVLSSKNQNFEKFSQFSGAVQVVVEIHMSWKNITGRRVNFEKWLNCLEDVMVDLMNRMTHPDGTDAQSWGQTAVWNGDIACKRGALRMAGGNFEQKIGFSLTFGLNA